MVVAKSKDVVDVHVYEPTEKGPFIGSIDQGTSSTRFVLISKRAVLVAAAQVEHGQIYDHGHPGYHEHDPTILWHNTVACMTAVVKAMVEDNAASTHATGTTSTTTDETDGVIIPSTLIAAIGITNQRETIIAWNKVTGKPYYNAIVWDDTRTATIAANITENLSNITGLPNSSYFSGTKVRWLMENVDRLREDVTKNPSDVCFGTVDSWILYQLTGQYPKSTKSGRKLKGTNRVNIGGCFKTDVTNASRWLFMDLKTCQWDPHCIRTILGEQNELPLTCLPEICPSSYHYGTVAECGVPSVLCGIPITSIMGDQQSALFGQAAFTSGEAKNTYGTGLFLMVNTGTTIVPSTHGLLTTVAYQLYTKDEPIHYALEGSISHGGSTIQWLRDGLNIIANASESETLARKTSSNEGCYLVPAFSGLFAPYWRSDARGCIVGLTSAHTKQHICRAALESMCYQSYKVFAAIQKDTGVALSSLKVDGGGTHNELMMQFQADMIQVPVIRPKVMETTALGAAFAAGLTISFWKDIDEIQALWAVDKTFTPRMKDEERQANLNGWDKAVSKSLGWMGEEAVTVAKTPEETPPTVAKTPELITSIVANNPPVVLTKNAEPTLSEHIPRATTIEEPSATTEPPPVKKTVSFSRNDEIVPSADPTPSPWTMALTAASVSLLMGIGIGRVTSRKK